MLARNIFASLQHRHHVKQRLTHFLFNLSEQPRVLRYQVRVVQ